MIKIDGEVDNRPGLFTYIYIGLKAIHTHTHTPSATHDLRLLSAESINFFTFERFDHGQLWLLFHIENFNDARLSHRLDHA